MFRDHIVSRPTGLAGAAVDDPPSKDLGTWCQADHQALSGSSCSHPRPRTNPPTVLPPAATVVLIDDTRCRRSGEILIIYPRQEERVKIEAILKTDGSAYRRPS
jgi:hypothetical protein